MNKKILIISRSGDAHLPFVTKHLQGEDVVLMNPSDVIFGHTIDFSFSKNGGGLRTFYKGEPLDNVKSVWLRRPVLLADRMRDIPLDDSYKPYIQNSLETHITMLAQAFPAATWMSEVGNIREADSKLLQMRFATKLGFNVPDTLFASDGKLAKAFVNKHKICIAKTQSSIFPKNKLVFTKIIRDSDGLDYTHLNLDPYIFQQYIEPSYELRITVVGDKVFATKVFGKETDGVESGFRDWRFAHANDTFGAAAAEISPELEEQCRQLVKELKLQFGAIDIIVDKDKKAWFLEINPNGQWAFVEQHTGQSIGKAVADVLRGVPQKQGGKEGS